MVWTQFFLGLKVLLLGDSGWEAFAGKDIDGSVKKTIKTWFSSRYDYVKVVALDNIMSLSHIFYHLKNLANLIVTSAYLLFLVMIYPWFLFWPKISTSPSLCWRCNFFGKYSRWFIAVVYLEHWGCMIEICASRHAIIKLLARKIMKKIVSVKWIGNSNKMLQIK